MATKKKTNTRDAPVIDYAPRTNDAVYFAKAIGEILTLPETDRTRLQVYLRKLIEVIEESGGGTEVIANPTLAGTEDALTGLQVGETKYKVDGGGGSLYEHRLRNWISDESYDGGIYFEFVMYSTNANAMTMADFINAYAVNDVLAYGSVGYATKLVGGTATVQGLLGYLRKTSATELLVSIFPITSGSSRSLTFTSSDTIIDTVTQII